MTSTQPAVSAELADKIAMFMDEHNLCELNFNRIDNTLKMDGRFAPVRFRTPLYAEGF